MTTSPALLGNTELKHIKLGAGRILRGTSPTVTFPGTAKIDLANPGPDWEDFGCIAQDVSINCTADQFSYRNGVPSMIKKKFVIARSATLNATFDEFKGRLMQIAIGLVNPLNKLAGAPATVAASPIPTATTFTLDTVAGLAVNDEIVVSATAPGLTSSQATGIIQSITALAVTLRQPLKVVPAAGNFVQERVCTKLIFGGNDVDSYPLLFVVDFVVDKKQFVVCLLRAASTGAFTPGLGGGTESAKIGVSWDCYGVYEPDIAENSVASIYMFEDES